MALKAGTVDNPPAGPEGAIYRELRRTRAAPQGICIANSAGKALAWTLGFDDDKRLAEFFDYAKRRYKANPSSGATVERFRRFPSAKLADVPDNGEELTVPAQHPGGEPCPGNLGVPEGTVAGRIVGRAYGADGNPLSEVRTQDNYIEDILAITPEMQRQLLERSKAADGARFPLPPSLAREIVGNAYLGMLDVNPLGGAMVRAELIEESIRLWAQALDDRKLMIGGQSLVHAKNREGTPNDDGRRWSHRVSLRWAGAAELDSTGLREIVLTADGKEKLEWGGPGSSVSPNAVNNPLAHLPGGRSLDILTAVRYGVIAER